MTYDEKRDWDELLRSHSNVIKDVGGKIDHTLWRMQESLDLITEWMVVVGIFMAVIALAFVGLLFVMMFLSVK